MLRRKLMTQALNFPLSLAADSDLGPFHRPIVVSGPYIWGAVSLNLILLFASFVLELSLHKANGKKTTTNDTNPSRHMSLIADLF